jgi:hypothetical protein
MRGAIGHEVLAGAIGGASILGGAFTSPLLAPAVDLASAALTAGVAAHAARAAARTHGVSARRVLRAAARRSFREGSAPLAAHAMEAAASSRSGASRLRAVAILVGRAFEDHARGLAVGVLASWCGPLRRASRALDAASAARVAMASADLVRWVGEEAEALASERCARSEDVEWLRPLADDRLEASSGPAEAPVSGRFPLAALVEAAETLEAA